MIKTSIKSVLAAGVLAVGAATTLSAPANAGGNFSLYIGNGHGPGVHYSHGPRRGYVHREHRRSKCKPRRALRKAWRYGLDDPYIQRINHRKVVVKGWNRGHRAKIVFSRHGRHCPIIRTRGI